MKFHVFHESTHWAKKNNIPCKSSLRTTSTLKISEEDFDGDKHTFKIYLSDFQSQGRGQKDRTWLNLDSGDAFLSSWCFKTSVVPKEFSSILVGDLLKTSLKQTWLQGNFRLKLPNDIYLNDKKIGGLLTSVERKVNGSLVTISLGLNVFSHPKSLSTSGQLHSKINPVSTKSWNLFLTLFLNYLNKALK